MAIGTPRDYEKTETYPKPTSKRGFGIPFHKPRPDTHEETTPLTETEKDSNPNERRWTRRHTLGAVAGSLALTIVGGSVYAATRPRPETTPPVGPEPSASAPQTPGTPEATPSSETVDGHEIKAGLLAEEYSKAFMERIGQWSNAGATPELAENWLLAGEASDMVLNEAVEQNMYEFAEDLLIQNYDNNAQLQKFVTDQADINRNTLWFYVRTTNPDVYPDDEEPFSRHYEVNETVEVEATEQGRTLEISFTEYNNGDKNRVWTENLPEDEQLGPNMKNFNNDKVMFRVTTQVEDGVEKIASIATVDIKDAKDS